MDQIIISSICILYYHNIFIFDFENVYIAFRSIMYTSCISIARTGVNSVTTFDRN